MTMIRFTWRYNSQAEPHTADVEIDGLTGEGVIKEKIATQLGDRTLAQYMWLDDHIERVEG